MKQVKIPYNEKKKIVESFKKEIIKNTSIDVIDVSDSAVKVVVTTPSLEELKDMLRSVMIELSSDPSMSKVIKYVDSGSGELMCYNDYPIDD